MIKRLTFFIILMLSVLRVSILCADELVAGFDVEKDLPILNEELRKIDEKSSGIDTRLTTAEASITALTAATQAQQETATSTSTYVSPGRQQYHTSAAKAWAVFDGTTVGTHAVTAGYNITSVTRNGTGDYTITWATDFSSANYAAFVLSATFQQNAIISMAAGTFNFQTSQSDGVLGDPSIVCVVAFGDQ